MSQCWQLFEYKNGSQSAFSTSMAKLYFLSLFIEHTVEDPKIQNFFCFYPFPKPKTTGCAQKMHLLSGFEFLDAIASLAIPYKRFLSAFCQNLQKVKKS